MSLCQLYFKLIQVIEVSVRDAVRLPMVHYNNAKPPRCSAGADRASRTLQEGNTFGRSNCTDVSPYDDSDATNTGPDERCVNVLNVTSEFPVGIVAFMKTALGLNSHDHAMEENLRM
jgi:hypothetical protein